MDPTDDLVATKIRDSAGGEMADEASIDVDTPTG